MKIGLTLMSLLVLAAGASAAPGPNSLALVAADGMGAVQTGMTATGQFTSVDTFYADSSTTLSSISGYGYVLVWTNSQPPNPSGLGDMLANYYDLGGKRLVISTYGLSTPWAVAGRVMTGSYVALSNVGTNGDVSGNVVPVNSADPIFAGITLSAVTFSHNSNYAHPALASGATLIATDGSGNNMIARSANGVMNVNMWPGGGGSTDFFMLMANILKNGGISAVPAIGPVSGAILMIGLVVLALYRLRKQTA